MTYRDEYKVAVFTFDHTICQRPTFFRFKNNVISYNQIRKSNSHLEFQFNPTDYQQGKKDAISTVKTGIQPFLLHDKHYVSAIATFHCYPDYIAGYIATILGKELTRIDEHSPPTNPYENTLIAAYQIEGVERPFLISYINPMQDRQSALRVLGSKTTQILQLRQVMVDNDWVSADEPVHLYEGVCSEPECANRFCGHPESVYVPKYSQLNLEIDLSVKIRSRIIVHRVIEGKQFEPEYTRMEREELAQKMKVEKQASEPSSSDQAETHEAESVTATTSPWSFGTALKGLGFFAVGAGLVALAVTTKTLNPR